MKPGKESGHKSSTESSCSSSSCDDFGATGCLFYFDPQWNLYAISVAFDPDFPNGDLYVYPNGTFPVNAYVFSTGIFVGHPDFRGHAVAGPDFVYSKKPSDNTDIEGSGTAVAGAIGSFTFGVSKTVKLISVKVLNDDGTGFLTAIIAGLEYVIAQHNQHGAHHEKAASVIDMSFQGLFNDVLKVCVATADLNGIHISVTAGTGNGPKFDACLLSPANADGALTVGDSDSNNVYGNNSFYGKCVDLIAPGTGVTALDVNREECFPYSVKDGMGSSMTSGVLALLLSICRYHNFTPAQLRKIILDMAVPDQVTLPNLGNSTPNLLLNFLVTLKALGCLNCDEDERRSLADL